MDWNTYLVDAGEALRSVHPGSVYGLARSLRNARENGRTVFTCGNGGSASTASHLAQDLAKGTLLPNRPRLRALCLCDSLPGLTAWANDEGYETAFAEQLKGLGRQGDLLIAISGSGNSQNVLNAVRAAHELEMRTWGVTGFEGGKLIHLTHRFVRVPCDDMGMVEAAHGVILHWLIGELLEQTEKTFCPWREQR